MTGDAGELHCSMRKPAHKGKRHAKHPAFRHKISMANNDDVNCAAVWGLHVFPMPHIQSHSTLLRGTHQGQSIFETSTCYQILAQPGITLMQTHDLAIRHAAELHIPSKKIEFGLQKSGRGYRRFSGIMTDMQGS